MMIAKLRSTAKAQMKKASKPFFTGKHYGWHFLFPSKLSRHNWENVICHFPQLVNTLIMSSKGFTVYTIFDIDFSCPTHAYVISSIYFTKQIAYY